MTSDAVHAAKGEPIHGYGSVASSYKPDGEAHPEYYYCLLYSVPIDIVTSPVQLYGLAIIHGGGLDNP
jgi:hypothetical protein